MNQKIQTENELFKVLEEEHKENTITKLTIQKKDNKNKPFRLRGKKFFLTYSNLKKQYKRFKLKQIFEQELKEKKNSEDVKYLIENLLKVDENVKYVIFPLMEKELYLYKRYENLKKENPTIFNETFYDLFPFKDLNLSKNKEIILEKIKEFEKIPKISQYIIAEELHKNDDLHYHLYVEFYQRVEIFSSNYLDLVFDDFIIHGSYETVRKKENVLTYITKCNNFIAEPDIPYYNGVLFTNYKDFLGALYKEEGLKGVENYLLKNVEVMLKGGASMLKHLETANKLKKKKDILEKDVNNIIPYEYFDLPPAVHKWYEGGCKRALMLTGPSGMGKTEGIKSFLVKNGITFLLVRNLHGLRAYDPEIHQAIIFDDLFLEKKLTTEELISLGDMANHCDFRVIRDSIRIMAHTLKLFTLNDPRKMITEKVDKYQVLRRYVIVEIDKSLFNKTAQGVDFEMIVRSTEDDEIVAHNRKILASYDQKRKEEEFQRENSNENIIELIPKAEDKVIPPWENPKFKDSYIFK